MIAPRVAGLGPASYEWAAEGPLPWCCQYQLPGRGEAPEETEAGEREWKTSRVALLNSPRGLLGRGL